MIEPRMDTWVFVFGVDFDGRGSWLGDMSVLTGSETECRIWAEKFDGFVSWYLVLPLATNIRAVEKPKTPCQLEAEWLRQIDGPS